MRGTCRALRRATKLAVGGLKDIKIGKRRDTRIMRKVMPFATAKSIPDVIDIDNIYGPGVVEFCKAGGFESVAFSGLMDSNGFFTADAVNVLRFSTVDTLQVLSLSTMDLEAVRNLFACLKPGLRELRMQFFPETDLPPMSKEVAKGISKLEMVNCEKADNVFRLVAGSNALEVIDLDCSRFAQPGCTKLLCKSRNLRKLKFSEFSGGRGTTSCHLEIQKLVGQGMLKSLTDLECEVYHYSRPSKLIAMLVGAKEQFRKLFLTFNQGLKDNIITVIAKIKFHSDCEVSLKVVDGNHRIPAGESSVLPLCKFNNLVHLHIQHHESNSGSRIQHLEKLSQLPRLRSLELNGCVVNKDSLVELATTSDTLTSLQMSSCQEDEKLVPLRKIAGKGWYVTLEDIRTGNFHATNSNESLELDKYFKIRKVENVDLDDECAIM